MLLLFCTWLALTPTGDRLTVAFERPGEVYEFDTAARTVVRKEQDGRREEWKPYVSDGDVKAWLIPEQSSLADHIAAKVCIKDDCLLLPNGSTGARGVAVAPDGRWAFVTHILARYTVHTTQLEQGWINTNALSIIDVPERKLHATVLLDDVDHGAANPWAVAVSEDSKRLFVTHAGTHELSVIDLPALLERIDSAEGDPANQLSFLAGIRDRVRLGGKGPRAIAVEGDNVWVAEYFSRTVSVVSMGKRPTVETYRMEPAEPMTIERRGEMLFHDATLCFQQWQSCSSCHPDARVDGLNWDLINDGIGNPKNTRSMLFSHKLPPVMWTGIRPSAEYAVRSGLRHIQFAEPNEADATAIDAYLRSLKPAPSPHDDQEAIARGRKLFFSADVGCVACHPPPLYTDNRLHDVGTNGRYDFTQVEFKTPTLVEVWRTAPYLHDGRYTTVEQVVTEGNHGDRRGKTSHLSAEQIRDLVEFVLSL